ncbi:MAG: M20/M25/M40 family metallo-hydrolase [Candidatus Roizmanbacteria bacterium]
MHHYADALKLLAEYIAIPSVSTDPGRKSDMDRAVVFLTGVLKDLGAQVQVVGTTHSLVVGYLQVLHAQSTIGIYGHYDVQPEDPEAEWHTPPFVLTQKDGKLYGRGVADNKGHIIQNLVAIKELISSSRLKNNVLFIFEGEEEAGSACFEDYLTQITLCKPSSVDVWYITDTGMRNMQVPQIYSGLRGLLYTELTIETGSRDLHSGIYGNRVYNAAHLLSTVISRLKDVETGRVNIPGFYEHIQYPDDVEYARLLQLQEVDEVTRHESGQFVLPPQSVIPDSIRDLDSGTMPGMTSKERFPRTLQSKLLPSCDIHGMESGYNGPGAKTVIPRRASAKISFRLVAGQNPDEIEEFFRTFLTSKIPTGVVWNLSVMSKEAAFLTDIQNPWMHKTSQALERVFGHPVQYNRSGGSIPAAGILQELFKKPVILTGFTQPDDCIHAPNENYPLEMFEKGIEALQAIYTA